MIQTLDKLCGAYAATWSGTQTTPLTIGDAVAPGALLSSAGRGRRVLACLTGGNVSLASYTRRISDMGEQA